jgi:hypothetical protein
MNPGFLRLGLKHLVVGFGNAGGAHVIRPSQLQTEDVRWSNLPQRREPGTAGVISIEGPIAGALAICSICRGKSATTEKSTDNQLFHAASSKAFLGNRHFVITSDPNRHE